jgi:hypothetical protein
MMYVNKDAFKAALLTAVRCRGIVAWSAFELAATFFPENTAPMEPDSLLLCRFWMPVEILATWYIWSDSLGSDSSEVFRCVALAVGQIFDSSHNFK